MDRPLSLSPVISMTVQRPAKVVETSSHKDVGDEGVDGDDDVAVAPVGVAPVGVGVVRIRVKVNVSRCYGVDKRAPPS